MSKLSPGTAVSPIDGRYASKTAELSMIFSEQALMRYRLIVEVEYLIFLFSWTSPALGFKVHEVESLRRLYQDFSDEDFNEIQKHEKTTNHDVKAVEYFLRDKMKGIGLEAAIEFVHIGRTSEDINNLAYALMLREGTQILIKEYESVLWVLYEVVDMSRSISMLAMTHGQPASPTTVGWEINVFCSRLCKFFMKLKDFTLTVKCNGATGGDNAMVAAFPGRDWRSFSKGFVGVLNEFEKEKKFSIKFENNPFTTQIEPHDTYAELFGILSILNTILLDFSKDMWLYISRGVFTQKLVAGEVGSSAMPQKINPINFENAEGNLGLANALFDFFRNKLPVSRMQRDLSDSTVERNFGTAYAHTLISLKAIKAGVKRVSVNKKALHEELETTPEVVSEAYQVILRAEGVSGGYERLMDLVRGKTVTMEILHSFVKELFDKEVISQDTANRLYAITPHNYIGNRNHT